MSKKVLLICTSHDRLGATTEAPATGAWAEEIAAPYYIFKDAGYDVTIASTQGGKIPLDENSTKPPYLTTEVQKFLIDDQAMEAITNSKKLDDTDISGSDAVYIVGGHGACWDFPDNKVLTHQLAAAYSCGKVIAAVCHGPTALVNVTVSGEPIVQGKKVTGFTNTEEVHLGKEDVVPFLLENKLKELGANFEVGEAWLPHAVRDGQLVTGQNPQSSAKTAELVREALAAA